MIRASDLELSCLDKSGRYHSGKNEDEQRIQIVKGTIYDATGKPLKSKRVSPGKIMTREQLKTLSRENIDERFKDVSAGNISPLGTLPVTIVFMDIPAGMAEAGLEVVR